MDIGLQTENRSDRHELHNLSKELTLWVARDGGGLVLFTGGGPLVRY